MKIHYCKCDYCEAESRAFKHRETAELYAATHPCATGETKAKVEICTRDAEPDDWPYDDD